MNLGEVISALALCAAGWDDENDRLLMLRGVYDIEVREEYIDVYFTDGNTENIRIFRDGRRERLSSDCN